MASWQTNMTVSLRALIGDLDSPPTYTDSRLQQMLVVAGSYVLSEVVNLPYSYTIDVGAITISPDPYTYPDNVFINFTVLKAACLIDVNTLRSKALVAGIRAQLGPARLDTFQHIPGFSELINQGPCAAYTRLKESYEIGNPIVKAILSPFISNNYASPISLDIVSNRDDRGFY